MGELGSLVKFHCLIQYMQLPIHLHRNHLRDTASYMLKVTNVSYPRLFGASIGVTPMQDKQGAWRDHTFRCL